LTSHSGTVALRELADRVGLTAALSAAAAPVSSIGLVHEPGAVLRDQVVMLTDGGDDFSAIETLRVQVDLDGAVASDSTAWRRVADLAGHELSVARLDTARRRVRATVWRHGGGPPAVDAGSGPVCVDVDATLVTAHSDKESAAGTYKRGYGFHPLLAYLDRDDGAGEATVISASSVGWSSGYERTEPRDSGRVVLVEERCDGGAVVVLSVTDLHCVALDHRDLAASSLRRRPGKATG